jgi:hypothetical protein
MQGTTVTGLPPAHNRRATVSVLVGMLAVVVVPLAILASSVFEQVTLVQACASAVVAALLGVVALAQASRGRETALLTLGRSGGETAARVGRWLGVIAVWIALTTGLAVGFYALLAVFAD